MKMRWWTVLTLGGLVLFGVLLVFVYPCSLEWTAPIVCPDDQPDSAVVRYETTVATGTGINFSMFCMNARGEFTEVGALQPFAVLEVGIAVSGLTVLGVYSVARRVRGSTPKRGPPPPEATLVH